MLPTARALHDVRGEPSTPKATVPAVTGLLPEATAAVAVRGTP